MFISQKTDKEIEFSKNEIKGKRYLNVFFLCIPFAVVIGCLVLDFKTSILIQSQDSESAFHLPMFVMAIILVCSLFLRFELNLAKVILKKESLRISTLSAIRIAGAYSALVVVLLIVNSVNIYANGLNASAWTNFDKNGALFIFALSLFLSSLYFAYCLIIDKKKA